MKYYLVMAPRGGECYGTKRREDAEYCSTGVQVKVGVPEVALLFRESYGLVDDAEYWEDDEDEEFEERNANKPEQPELRIIEIDIDELI